MPFFPKKKSSASEAAASQPASKSIDFDELYKIQSTKVNKIMEQESYNDSNPSDEFYREYFKKQILCFFLLLYSDIIHTKIEDKTLKRPIKDFNRIIGEHTPVGRYLKGYLEEITSQSQEGGMKRTRKVKRTKSKSKSKSKRTKHRK
jgi:hypothetical protein